MFQKGLYKPKGVLLQLSDINVMIFYTYFRDFIRLHGVSCCYRNPFREAEVKTITIFINRTSIVTI